MMDRYICNKEVEAFQIKVIKKPHGVLLDYYLYDKSVKDPKIVDKKWFKKWNPKINGYFIKELNGEEIYLSLETFFQRGFLKVASENVRDLLK